MSRSETIHVLRGADVGASDGVERGPDQLPVAIRLFRFGSNPTSKGDFVLTREGAKRVMDRYADHGVELAFDYEHMAVQDPPQEAPAAGWFKLAMRDDGLWAVAIRWTPRAAERLRGKEYRYFSPAFTTDEKNVITRLVNCALTNQPATKNQTPLVAARQGTHTLEKEKTMSDETLKALTDAVTKCTAAVNEYGQKFTSIEERLSALEDSATKPEKKDEEPVATGDFAKDVLTLTGKTSVSEALGVLKGHKAAAEQAQKLSQRVAELEAEKVNAEAERLVNEAVTAGKVEPAAKAQMLELGKKDVVQLRALLAVLPSRVPGGNPAASPTQPKDAPATVTLTDEEKEQADKYGIPLDKVLETKKRMHGHKQ